jgi:hypothetical protein
MPYEGAYEFESLVQFSLNKLSIFQVLLGISPEMFLLLLRICEK